MSGPEPAEGVALVVQAVPPTAQSDGKAEAPGADAQQISPKLDPESLALRQKPPLAKRFKREAIITLSAITALVIAVAAWYALKGVDLHLAGRTDEGTQARKGPPDAIAGLPQSYDGVPKLGPPLPGDLGRPILQKQREGGLPSLAQPEAAAKPVQDSTIDHAEEERRAARTSGLFFSSSQAASNGLSESVGGGSASAGSASAPPATSGSKMAIDFAGDPNAQQRKADFVAEGSTGNDVEPHVLVPAVSPNMLSAGSVIPASLITGLRSDLPGMVIAQVTQQVFDSATGHVLLVPQGARLIGSYDSLVAFGQKRALIVWQRIVMPDGSSIRLDNVPASDLSGYAGLEDQVDAHTWQIVKGAAISTLLGIGSELTFTGEGDLVQAIRQSTQQSVSRAGDRLVSRSLQTQPTITIRPGAPVRLVIHRDLILPPWHSKESQ
jgi:type IV secretion system protein VirB10